MNLQRFLQEIKGQQQRFFPEAHVIILEELPWYLKVRIDIAESLFIDIRFNARNRRRSYVFVRNGRRIAGFDNLDGWHLHPVGRPDAHRKIRPPSLRQVFAYFAKAIRLRE